jgi:hypothetical protein
MGGRCALTLTDWRSEELGPGKKCCVSADLSGVGVEGGMGFERLKRQQGEGVLTRNAPE